MFEGECRDVECRIVVDKPFLWNAENPYLYSVYSKIYEDGVQLDEQVDTIGIRTLSVDAKHGYCINGKPVKFRGACIHHDCGILGAATFYDAEYRRVRILKESGFNAIRSAHQPAAPALLRACDELGMYVMDEAFDMWTRCKSDNDYGLFFGECWEKDIELMVKKDFNHPSVVMYSIGNEIPEIGTDHGAKLCYDIAEKIKKLDGSRYTLAAINGIFASGDVIPQILNQIMEEKPNTEGNVNNFMAVMDANINHIVVHDEVSKRLEKACANVDIAGYNYMSARYEGDGKKYPNRIIVGSETYPSDIAKNWELVNKLNYVIGDFTWTGWDYIGEAGIGVPAYQPGDGGFDAKFPCQLAYCGDIDLTGHRRPASYYREIVYGLRKKPYIAVQNPYRHGEEIIKTPWIISDTLSSWSYPKMEGKPIVVEVYSAGDEVELLINGKSQGRRRSGRETGYITVFETVYEVGEIEAITWEKGVELGREKVCTAGANTRLIFEIEEGPESELIYVNIKNVDCNGILATQEVRTIKCEIEGQADIWFGSGNPKPQNNYLDAVTQTWNGKALLIVRKRNNAQVKLHIERETLII